MDRKKRTSFAGVVKNKNDPGWDRLPPVLRHPTVLYAVLTELAGKPAEYQASMLLTCIGKDALAIVNSLPYNQEADRKYAEKILELLEKRCT